MSHPPRYRDDDPFLARLRRVTLTFPEAKEKVSHGLPNFFTVKVFAQFGAVVKGDHDADDLAQSLVFLPDENERRSLLEDTRFFVPAYVGAYGWVGLNFRAATPDWTEVTELVDMSYRNTAPRRLVSLLDHHR
ncbi:MAG: MmcQ/YjbR family DNA-binding protein [Dermatophilaceae bacterium]